MPRARSAGSPRRGRGLVGVQHRGGVQQLPDPVHERRQQPGGLAPDACHEPGRDVHAGQRGDQPGGAGDRQVVRADRQRGLRVHSRPVLHPPGHPGQRQPDRNFPAFRALPRGDLVLGHRRRRGRGRLEHLPFLHRAQHRLAGQVMPAAAARGRPRNTVSPGSGDCFSVEDCAPGCLPGLRPDLPRSDRSRGFF